MTASGYAVLAWNAGGVQIGSLLGQDLELEAVAPDLPLEDIRNCSSAREQPWGAITAVNRRTRRQELWRLDLEGTRAESLVALDYILHNAIDPAGRYICYTAPPLGTRGDVSLYGYDPQACRSDLLVEGAVSRDCIPSWRSSTGKVVYHAVDRHVVQVDISTKRVERLFSGEYPAVSPDGTWIAYRDGSEVRVWNTEDQRPRNVSKKRWFWEGQLQGGMSWSPEGKFLLVGQSAGVFGYELAFYRIEVQTGRRVRVRQRYLKGLRFR